MRRTRLVTAVAAAAAGALEIVGGATVVDGPSEATATPEEILRFHADHAGQMQVSVVATILAGLALLVFAAGAGELFRPGEGILGRLVGMAGVAPGILLLAGQAPRAVLLREDLGDIDPTVLSGWYALNDLTDMLVDAAVVTAALTVAAFGLVAARTRVLPRALGWVAGVIGVVGVAGSLATLDGPVDGPFVVCVSAVFMLWPVWMVAAGITGGMRGARVRQMT